jgi:hypothetical protein
VRQKAILLRFVETMDFIDKEHGALTTGLGGLSLGDGLANFSHARQHRAELHQLCLKRCGIDLCERGFT